MNFGKKIGIIGGTGKLGSALAVQFSLAGYKVMIGSRSEEKSEEVSKKLNEEFNVSIEYGSNVDAAKYSDLILLTVPFSSQLVILEEISSALQGKLLVDATVPLCPPKVMRVQLPDEGSAAVRSQKFLGSEVNVVSAFHNVAAGKLLSKSHSGLDVLVFGDDLNARQVVVELVNDLGLRGVHAGALVNSVAAEALTSVLIYINKMYGVDGAGFVISGDLSKFQAV